MLEIAKNWRRKIPRCKVADFCRGDRNAPATVPPMRIGRLDTRACQILAAIRAVVHRHIVTIGPTVLSN